MNGKRDLWYDPLYRVVEKTEEIQFIEGHFKELFDRLKGINNLGIIPEVLEMAKYPKYEHHLGTVYQINCLLECMDKDMIPEVYHLPLKLSALFLHSGHLPFTYSTERALLLASSLGTDDRNNNAKNYVKKRIERVLQQANFDDKEREKHLEKLFSVENYKVLYRYFSCLIFLEKWKKIQEEYELKDEDKETIIRNLIDSKNDGYRYLELANKADFVQRDALYFGTVRLDISPKHLYGQGLLGHTSEIFSVDEKELIESNLDYLRERFYDSDRIRWVSRLYEKIVASLILSKNFKMEWVDKLDDSEFKRIITENNTPNKPANLSKNWIKRANDLFENGIHFSVVFELSDISFEKQKNVIDIEYKLLGKSESTRGLLVYPFEKGLLLDIEYLRKQRFPSHPNYWQFSVGVFQNDSQRRFIELINIIEQLSHYCSIIGVGDKKTSHIRNIREGICKQFSWTGSIRIDNKNVIEAISESIENIENGDAYEKGEFLSKFLKGLSSIETFYELWYNFENQFFWLSRIEGIVKEHKEDIEKSDIRKYFVEGMLSLPVRLLQFKTTEKYLDEIYKKLLEMIPNAESNEKKGYLFEALLLIDSIREKKGTFQFLINGMVVVDPTKPKDERDIHEFDVIELFINESDKAECWISACSIADDYEQKNREQLDKLARNIHRVYSDLRIRTRYIIPENKGHGVWKPKEEETGVGSWN